MVCIALHWNSPETYGIYTILTKMSNHHYQTHYCQSHYYPDHLSFCYSASQSHAWCGKITLYEETSQNYLAPFFSKYFQNLLAMH
jgi:hypothetical protein